MQNGLLQACDSIIIAIKKENCVSRLRSDFPKIGAGTQFNGLFRVGSMQDMLEYKNCKSVDLVY